MKDKYLRETRMVDFSNPAIQKLIQNMKWKEMGEFRLQKYLQMVMDNVIQKELYLWHFYVPAIFHAEYMALRLIKDCRKGL